MKEFTNADDILDWAIAREEEAAVFYSGLAKKMTREWMVAVFEDFAKEERGHKSKLEAVKQGRLMLNPDNKITDLKIGDYLVAVDPGEENELDYQKALIIAMKREKSSFRLYSDLAERVSSEDLKLTFRSLALEEAKHKLRFEIEYDDLVLTEN